MEREPRRSRSLPRRPVPYLLVGAGLLALLGTYGPRPTTELAAPVTAGPDQPAAAAATQAPPEIALNRAYRTAAKAYREGNAEESRRRLAELAEQAPGEMVRVQTLLGLQAYTESRWADAVDILSPLRHDTKDDLADWRLRALAESAAREGLEELSTTALESLLREHPGSTLRGPALESLASLAAERGDLARSFEVLATGRKESLGAASRRSLDTLTWKLARKHGEPNLEQEAARRLLVSSPSLATDLGVLDTFRPPEVVIDDWEGILSDSEVVGRAESWLREDRPAFGEATLGTIPQERRGFHWHLMQAKILADQGRGDEAYLTLAGMVPASSREEATLEWVRAVAAADVAAPSRGEHRSSAERQRWLERSRKHLQRVVSLDAPAEVSLQALRTLYGHLAEEGRFDESMELLHTLRRIDPEDRTGAEQLWALGWREYRDENYTGAVGYWSQLEQIYPDDRDTHRGRYWKARALEEIGEETRARHVYRDLLRTSDTADFYVRQARQRLDGEQALQTPGSLSRDWPRDPLLRRVLHVSELGLDSLAERELETIVGDGLTADRKDARALTGVVQVRQGRVRSGVPLLRDAFPSLGGPYQAAVPSTVLEAYYPLPFHDAIRTHSQKRDLDPALVAGIIRQESAFDPAAESWAGARGLMQLMPATAKEVSGKLGHGWEPARLFDPSFSIELGTSYFRYVLDRFDGNVELALAGYNGGPNRIRRLWREAGPEPRLDSFLENLDITESRDYVKRILVLSDSYRQLYPAGP